jgi:hypothetical protein
VSERLIAVMLGGADPGAAIPPRPAATSADSRPTVGPSTVSAAGREAGIYFNVGGKMTALEPTVFSGGKSGGLFTSGLTMGIKKAKWKAVVRSPAAVQRLQSANPEFHFYFESRGAGLSNTGVAGMLGASSPNEFVLARMTQKETERELIVGEFGAFGASSGTRSEDTVELVIEKVEPGVYKVTTKTPLPAGEYCFFYASGASAFNAAGTGKLFDFGVDAGVGPK